jgi:pyruvate-ferredoxin/flavodoxin oxidoreductase
MSSRSLITVDGNEAVASIAHRVSEVIAIYPITPSSPIGELADAWSAEGRPNLWGQVPQVVEMQSEGGAAGAVHGALEAGALATTFTASQGLLLMIPNMYKIAGELLPFTMHVAARTIATHALSIFGDHSDVMAARQTGFAMLAAANVQEAHDFAAVAHAATLTSRIPFLHFFDGFRTSHQIETIEPIDDNALAALIGEDGIRAHRLRALTPDRPVIRGTAENPDTFFQASEAANGYYLACPGIVRRTLAQLATLTGRRYDLFDYHGHPQADRVVVLMGSGVETLREVVDALNASGEQVGVLAVRLYRPFDTAAFLAALPSTVARLAVLDRSKEPGATGEPLYQDVLTALVEAESAGTLPFTRRPQVIAGRYGLASKEFGPDCALAVFAELARERPKPHFTVGFVDDVTHLSLPLPAAGDFEPAERVRAVFWGLGADGTVGANKNSIKIIGESGERYAQGYFVYDSKKAGAVTVSHLRFGPQPIRSPYLVQQASFVACHQFELLERYDVLATAAPGATFLLNSPWPLDAVWDRLPREAQDEILAKKLRFYVIDAHALAREAGLGGRINTILQTCFFAISGVLERADAIAHIKKAIEKTYGKGGRALVEQNFAVVDKALDNLHEVTLPTAASSWRHRPPVVSTEAPELVQKVTAMMLAGKGDALPVSAFPVDGTWPTGTARWEKRNLAIDVPIWQTDLCIQCNQCVLLCPHAAIRAKVYETTALAEAPEGFRSVPYKAKDLTGLTYTLQVAPEDCTGCRLCVEVCPARDRSNPRRKALVLAPRRDVLEQEKASYDFFLDLPEIDRERIARIDAKGSQFFQPLFEYSGACAGCGETPYVKLLTQLFGDRLLVANATGCSSIYGGNLPTTPYTVNREGRGPAWANSLFEDNAEFGLGLRLGVDALTREARQLLGQRAVDDNGLAREILDAACSSEAELVAQRQRVLELRQKLTGASDRAAQQLLLLADYLVEKKVWLVGGDGWAYDIGYGGLDHVLALGRDTNVLVLDTEVYSNTGGQQSKATPLGASAKFAAAGRELSKKDLGLEAMSYGHVYVARIAIGANVNQAVRALQEAAAYPGPSLVIAYSHCVAHGYDMAQGATQQRAAVSSWVWPLYRFDPRLAATGKPPLQLDSGPPTTKVRDYMAAETRFRMVEKMDPARYRRFAQQAQHEAVRRYGVYRQLAGVITDHPATGDEAGADDATVQA